MMNSIEKTQEAIRAVSDSTISERRILVVPISTILHTPYNPGARTKEGAKLEKLTDAVRKYGLIYPVLITSDRYLIDGNRRLTACRKLGHETIECIISPIDRDEAFTAINTSSMSLGGKGWLEMAHKGGILPAKEAAQYAELASLVGAYGIGILIKHNIGLNVLPLSKAVLNIGVKKPLASVIMEIATRRLTNKINAELRADKPDARKATAIRAILKEAPAEQAEVHK